MFHCLTGRTNLALVDSTHAEGVDLTLLAGVRGLVSVETRAAVFARGSSGFASKTDVAGGLVAGGAGNASWVGELSVGANVAAIANIVHLLTSRALVTGDRAVDEIEGSRLAGLAGYGLGCGGVISYSTQLADCRAVGVIGVGAGCTGRTSGNTLGRGCFSQGARITGCGADIVGARLASFAVSAVCFNFGSGRRVVAAGAAGGACCLEK